MDAQYIVDLKGSLTGDSDKDTPFPVALDLVARWLRSTKFPDAEITGTRLSSGTGREEGASGTLVQWTVHNSELIRCTHLTLSHPIRHTADATWITQVTVADRDDEITIRIEMGRDTGGVLRPSTFAALRRPALLPQLVQSTDLKLRTATYSEAVTNRVTEVPDDPRALQPVREWIGDERRLPILLVDGNSGGASKVGRRSPMNWWVW